jgi:hypothetical protein
MRSARIAPRDALLPFVVYRRISPHGVLLHYLTLPLEQLPSTLIFKLRTESVEALRAGMDQHTEVVDVSDNGGGGGGRPPFYLSRRDFIPTLRFSLQRANSRIRNADSKRRNARNGRKYASGTRSF